MKFLGRRIRGEEQLVPPPVLQKVAEKIEKKEIEAEPTEVVPAPIEAPVERVDEEVVDKKKKKKNQ